MSFWKGGNDMIHEKRYQKRGSFLSNPISIQDNSQKLHVRLNKSKRKPRK